MKIMIFNAEKGLAIPAVVLLWEKNFLLRGMGSDSELTAIQRIW